MKPMLLLLVTAINALSATITVTNQTQTSYAALNSRAQPIPTNTGYVAIGAFSLDDATIESFNSSHDFDALLEGFTQFGNSLTMGSLLGGYYQGLISGDIREGDSFNGLQVYSMIAEGTSLTNPRSIIVYKHEGTFFQPDPSITPDAILLATSENILIGTEITVTINGQERLGIYPSFIPEPSSLLLYLISAAFFLFGRRRRNTLITN